MDHFNRFTACACMGPMYGEPKCYCAMKREGLPLNEAARAIEEERAKKQLEALFATSGPFHRPVPST